ncbi:hypothetical protein LQG66_03055 [Bradyrhizobium ontarionense]|uniref:DUF2125 domain-containing protein n=1 Tax=Bradyrhizobium ontarionense TaxID=2898149 RepID=A0ABY3RD25_9BRAD|nr:hypothetical protein [Bradyrhizobium sp. A19]UFZ05315.1 hypothetical protein LQG66_03055 [Bradyrhizobium sp. A19]
MSRILIGALVAVVLGVAGFLGVPWYAQSRAEREVEAGFAQIRQNGATASHGKVAFDLWTRKLSIADVKIESAAQPPASVTLGNIVATGLSQPDSEHVAASSIEVSDITMAGQIPGPSALRLSYKLPQLVVKDYTGPARFAPAPGTGPIETYRALTQQFVAIRAASITAPRINGTMEGDPSAAGPAEFAYGGLVIDDIKDGHIASYRVDEMTFTMTPQQPNGKAAKMQGRMADIVTRDIDANAVAALLAPDSATDDKLWRFSGGASAGAYEVNSDIGLRMHMDGIKMGAFGVRPSRVQLPALVAAMTTGAPKSAAMAPELMDKVAGVYDGVQFKDVEVLGFAVETPDGPVKIATTRFDLDDGKGDIAFEGFDGRTPNGPVKLGRFALKRFDIAGLLRLSAKYGAPGAKPAPAEALALFRMLEGIELKDVTTPYRAGGKPVRIDNINLNWGQFVGPIPTQARLVAKMAGPLDASNPALLPLLVAGIDTAAFDADVGLGWTESSGAFALQPFKLEVSNLVAASASVSLARVPRDVFTIDLQQATTAAAQIEAVGLELTLRDLGAVDVLVANYARGHAIPRDAARKALIDAIKAIGAQVAAANIDAASAVDAISRFVERPRQTFTLKLTPRAKVPAMQLAQLIAIDPPSALAQFKIEAQTAP